MQFPDVHDPEQAGSTSEAAGSTSCHGQLQKYKIGNNTATSVVRPPSHVHPHSLMREVLDNLLHSLQSPSSPSVFRPAPAPHEGADSSHARLPSAPVSAPLPSKWQAESVGRCLRLLEDHPGHLTARSSTLVTLYSAHSAVADTILVGVSKKRDTEGRLGAAELFLLGSVAAAGRPQWEGALAVLLGSGSSTRVSGDGCSNQGHCTTPLSAASWCDMLAATGGSPPAVSWLLAATVMHIERVRHGRLGAESFASQWECCVSAVRGHLMAQPEEDSHCSAGIPGTGIVGLSPSWIFHLAVGMAANEATGWPLSWSPAAALPGGLMMAAHSSALAAACRQLWGQPDVGSTDYYHGYLKGSGLPESRSAGTWWLSLLCEATQRELPTGRVRALDSLALVVCQQLPGLLQALPPSCGAIFCHLLGILCSHDSAAGKLLFKQASECAAEAVGLPETSLAGRGSCRLPKQGHGKSPLLAWMVLCHLGLPLLPRHIGLLLNSRQPAYLRMALAGVEGAPCTIRDPPGSGTSAKTTSDAVADEVCRVVSSALSSCDGQSFLLSGWKLRLESGARAGTLTVVEEESGSKGGQPPRCCWGLMLLLSIRYCPSCCGAAAVSQQSCGTCGPAIDVLAASLCWAVQANTLSRRAGRAVLPGVCQEGLSSSEAADLSDCSTHIAGLLEAALEVLAGSEPSGHLPQTLLARWRALSALAGSNASGGGGTDDRSNWATACCALLHARFTLIPMALAPGCSLQQTSAAAPFPGIQVLLEGGGGIRGRGGRGGSPVLSSTSATTLLLQWRGLLHVGSGGPSFGVGRPCTGAKDSSSQAEQNHEKRRPSRRRSGRAPGTPAKAANDVPLTAAGAGPDSQHQVGRELQEQEVSPSDNSLKQVVAALSERIAGTSLEFARAWSSRGSDAEEGLQAAAILRCLEAGLPPKDVFPAIHSVREANPVSGASPGGDESGVWPASICKLLCGELATLAPSPATQAPAACCVKPAVLAAAASALEAACSRLLGTSFQADPEACCRYDLWPPAPPARGWATGSVEGRQEEAATQLKTASYAWLPMDGWGGVPLLQAQEDSPVPCPVAFRRFAVSFERLFSKEQYNSAVVEALKAVVPSPGQRLWAALKAAMEALPLSACLLCMVAEWMREVDLDAASAAAPSSGYGGEASHRPLTQEWPRILSALARLAAAEQRLQLLHSPAPLAKQGTAALPLHFAARWAQDALVRLHPAPRQPPSATWRDSLHPEIGLQSSASCSVNGSRALLAILPGAVVLMASVSRHHAVLMSAASIVTAVGEYGNSYSAKQPKPNGEQEAGAGPLAGHHGTAKRKRPKTSGRRGNMRKAAAEKTPDVSAKRAEAAGSSSSAGQPPDGRERAGSRSDLVGGCHTRWPWLLQCFCNSAWWCSSKAKPSLPRGDAGHRPAPVYSQGPLLPCVSAAVIQAALPFVSQTLSHAAACMPPRGISGERTGRCCVSLAAAVGGVRQLAKVAEDTAALPCLEALCASIHACYTEGALRPHAAGTLPVAAARRPMHDDHGIMSLLEDCKEAAQVLSLAAGASLLGILQARGPPEMPEGSFPVLNECCIMPLDGTPADDWIVWAVRTAAATWALGALASYESRALTRRRQRRHSGHCNSGRKHSNIGATGQPNSDELDAVSLKLLALGGPCEDSGRCRGLPSGPSATLVGGVISAVRWAVEGSRLPRLGLGHLLLVPPVGSLPSTLLLLHQAPPSQDYDTFVPEGPPGLTGPEAANRDTLVGMSSQHGRGRRGTDSHGRPTTSSQVPLQQQRHRSSNPFVSAAMNEDEAGLYSEEERDDDSYSDLEDFIVCDPDTDYQNLLGRRRSAAAAWNSTSSSEG
mmetsp:Transcript_30938/g.87658  ORF Transcript_30938/g.87658 Transcript_30938/m.87658 type:complete len:1845 (+) Transcript_30938:527-6061(+)|eukprot:CAMPEP_0117657180 /NCGR_PEP_ID=MMETSP0804-20121206/5195_1 /TAXON_ID=1074897 /ORGANISM="Tetraselmis astigmatica, Strain CCMP880" /LENGTH=1844 /DNA_ID=CAMNT_0005463621 /DNA_START=408 /DNA_END=5945 /DNA_ORIENTATION=-